MYTKVATGITPELVIYLLDNSASMQESLDGASKIDHVNDAVKSVIQRMVKRSTKGAIISPRYHVAMACYSESVVDIFNGVKTITEVAQLGVPKLSVVGTTDTHSAFVWARDLLRAEMGNYQDHPAPVVCHLTDGAYNAADPEPVAQEIMAMSNADGNVLVENIYVGPNLTKTPISDIKNWPGISDESALTDDPNLGPLLRKLFRMSSPLPQSYASVIQEDGFAMAAGCRMLMPATNKSLIELAFAMSGATPVVPKQLAAAQ